jgi:dTDP-4-dehydrorhamnose reductase
MRIHPRWEMTAAPPLELICAGRAECDMRNTAALRAFLADVAPSAIINTAAYTDVEAAEVELWPAVALNAIAVKEVAAFAESQGLPFIHVSTDYVYDGAKGEPYVEADCVRPISAYGYSKALGDDAVIKHGGVVLRTAWLFSGHNRNFARTMMALAQSRDVVRVVDDQRGNPTCADDLASVCIALAERMIAGEKFLPLYLVAGGPPATWADLADAVFEAMAAHGLRRPRLDRITTAEYPTKAKRPLDTRLDTSRFEAAFPDINLDWRPAVTKAVAVSVAQNAAA